MKLVIGSDHAGFSLKEIIKDHLMKNGHEVLDFGPFSTESVDYPDYATMVCNGVLDKKGELGILICGTGIGMSMAANKVKGIRAALCHDVFSAHATKAHNNANVLCMGERIIGPGLAMMITDEFVKTEFEGGRHQRRVDKICKIEEE